MGSPTPGDLLNTFAMLTKCKDAKFYTQLDLASGYWCLAVHEEDREKTAFSVPNGKYEFKRMPFGLKNSQATFQRMIETLIPVKSENLISICLLQKNWTISHYNLYFLTADSNT